MVATGGRGSEGPDLGSRPEAESDFPPGAPTRGDAQAAPPPAPHVDAPQPAGPRADAPAPGTSQPDTSRPDTSQPDTSQPETSPETSQPGSPPRARRLGLRRSGRAGAAKDPAVVAGEASAEKAIESATRQATPPTTPDVTAAAFFDVDNTIMRGASIFQLARGLYRREFFTLRDLAGWAWQQTQFRLVGESLAQVEAIQAEALGFVQGHSVAELRAIGEEIFDELIADRIWPGTLALAMTHIEAGQRVWLVTATPVEVADVIAARLGLTGALGTVADHVNGIYTGRLVGQPMHGQAKAEAVRALAAREGLDLERCSAYSDSANDIPMLSLVGHPCAINPDKILRAYARKHGWRVRDYRKGRRAARIAVPVAAAAGAAAGAGVAGVAVGRRWRT